MISTKILPVFGWLGIEKNMVRRRLEWVVSLQLKNKPSLGTNQAFNNTVIVAARFVNNDKPKVATWVTLMPLVSTVLAAMFERLVAMFEGELAVSAI